MTCVSASEIRAIVRAAFRLIGVDADPDAHMLAPHEQIRGTIDLHHQSTDNWSNSLKLYSRKSDIRRRHPYTAEEYRDKIGWGHSAIDQVVKLADRAQVKGLFLFHHDPSQADKDIAAKLVSRCTVRDCAIEKGQECCIDCEQLVLSVHESWCGDDQAGRKDAH